MNGVAARSWKYRRRLVFGVTGAACAGLAYLIGWGADTDLHRQIAGSLGTIIITVIAVYVGGATADDALKDKYGESYENRTGSGPQFRSARGDQDYRSANGIRLERDAGAGDP